MNRYLTGNATPEECRGLSALRLVAIGNRAASRLARCMMWMTLVGLALAQSTWAQCAWAESPELRRPYRATANVQFAEAGGEKLLADIYYPDDDQLHPAVLLIHGGAWSAGDKWNMRDHGRELAQAGYFVASINYRLAPRHKYPAQLEDCQSALKWLGQVSDQYRIDLDRVAVYGYSAGGHLAALLATEATPGAPKVRLAIIGGAPCDLSFIPEDSQIIAHVLGGSRAQVPLRYRDASPVTYASSDDCPMFFFHGDKDMIVPAESSRSLYDRMRQLGVEVDYYRVENQGHLITFIHPDPRRRAIEFLNKHLQRAP